MCRYADHEYRTHYACLPCRHSAKFPPGSAPRCPSCATAMVELGHDFAAPRKSSTAQWRKLEILVAAGVSFDSCGCTGPGARPRTLGEARHPIMGPSQMRLHRAGIWPNP